MRRHQHAGLILAIVIAHVAVACSAVGGDSVAATDAPEPSASPTPPPGTASATPSPLPAPSLVACPTSPPPGASPIVLGAEEALSCDLAAAAAQSGTTIEEEYARYRAAEIVGEIATRIALERPEIFVGSALSEEADGPPTLYIKGPADPFVLGLVDAAEIEIIVADHQPYSFEELEQRSARVSTALLYLGFTNFSVGVDIRTGRLTAAVTIEDGLPTDPADVVALLPTDLKGSLELAMSETPVAVDTIPQ